MGKLLPIKFLTFLWPCVFGDDVITSEALVKSFEQFVATEDREALDKHIGDDFNALDCLASFKCFKGPSKKKLEAIIIELVHQELFQNPWYVTNSWSPILKVLCSEENFQSLKKLNIFYQRKQPKGKKINELFRAEPGNEAEHTSFEHLKLK